MSHDELRLLSRNNRPHNTLWTDVAHSPGNAKCGLSFARDSICDTMRDHRRERCLYLDSYSGREYAKTNRRLRRRSTDCCLATTRRLTRYVVEVLNVAPEHRALCLVSQIDAASVSRCRPDVGLSCTARRVSSSMLVRT